MSPQPKHGNVALQPVAQDGWQTYNFEVEDFHTYVAGGLRVHNQAEVVHTDHGAIRSFSLPRYFS